MSKEILGLTTEIINKKVKVEENRLKEYHKQMDEDFDLWDLKRRQYDTHETAINVTLPDPRLFADDVQGRMARAGMQIRIGMAEKDGLDKRDDISKLENLLTFAFEKADELLGRKLLPPLRDSVIWHGLLRGGRAARVFVYKSGKDVIFDIVSWDWRWVTYKVGADGPIWTAHKTFREKEIIKDEYGVEPKASLVDAFLQVIPFTQALSNYEVIDYWSVPDSKKPTEILNAIVSGDTWLKEPEIFILPSIPVVIRPVAVRPPINSKTNLTATRHGESIYAPNRDTYELLNRLHSIEATRGNLLSKQPIINYKKGDGLDFTSTFMQAESVINVPEETNRFDKVPMNEVSITLLDLIDKLTIKKERGEVPHIDIGKPYPSGTLFGQVEEAGKNIYVPQLGNLSLFYGDMCRLIEEQLISGKLKVNVETEIKKKYYKTKVTPVDLKMDHTIKVAFNDRTPWMELEVAQQAEMLKRQGIPDEFIWENVYMMQDPKGLKDMVAVEIAEHSPNLMRLAAISKLLKAGRDDEAIELIKEHRAELLAQQQLGVEPGAQSGAQPQGV